MKSYARRFVSCALFIAAFGSGCTSLHLGKSDDCDCPEPKRRSPEWYAMEAQKPVGARQLEKKGKLWPPYARPCDDGGQQFCHEYHSAHYWPWPYVCDDRRYVREITQSQINNGWISETTLYSYHFDESSNELTESGRLHLRWILENTPTQHRAVYVQNTSAEQNQIHLASVQKAAAEIAGDGNVPPISLRVTSPLGRPALEVDAIRRAEIGSIPEPRIPLEMLPTGTGGGGS